MVETQTRDVAHPGHNPFDDPRPKRPKGFWYAVLIALAVHVALGLYLWLSLIHI